MDVRQKSEKDSNFNCLNFYNQPTKLLKLFFPTDLRVPRPAPRTHSVRPLAQESGAALALKVNLPARQWGQGSGGEGQRYTRLSILVVDAVTVLLFYRLAPKVRRFRTERRAIGPKRDHVRLPQSQPRSLSERHNGWTLSQAGEDHQLPILQLLQQWAGPFKSCSVRGKRC